MNIPGLENLTAEELDEELARGGRFVFYEYCISFIFGTLRRPSAVRLLRAGEGGFWPGVPYSLVSLVLGWWGLPWGFVYTPLSLVTNFGGGRDVTAQVRALLRAQGDVPTAS